MSKFKMNGFPSHNTGVQHKTSKNPVRKESTNQAIAYGSQGAQLGLQVGGPIGAAVGATGGAIYGYIQGDKADHQAAVDNRTLEAAEEKAAVANLYNTRKSAKDTEGSMDLSNIKPKEVVRDTTKIESQPAQLEALYANPIAKKNSLKQLIENDRKLKTIKK